MEHSTKQRVRGLLQEMMQEIRCQQREREEAEEIESERGVEVIPDPTEEDRRPKPRLERAMSHTATEPSQSGSGFTGT